MVAPPNEAPASKDQERAEDIDHPVQPVEQEPGEEDQDATHHHRAENAPEEHPVLVDRRHKKGREDQQHDKDVVDAQRIFEQITGRPFDTGLGPLREVDTSIEDQREPDPDATPDQRLTPGNGAGFTMKHTQVEREHGYDEGEKANPGQEIHESGHELIAEFEEVALTEALAV